MQINFRKICPLVIFTLCAVAGYSQTSINNYKYVLLAQKFDFLAGPDEYGLNTAAKYLLEQKGFVVIWGDGNLPPAIAANKCTALVAEVTQRKAFLTTNLTLLLKDCMGNVIFKGKEGKSREKDFEPAYKEALNEAFKPLNAVPYKYDSTLSAQQPQLAPASAQPASAQPASAQPAPASAQPASASPQPSQLSTTSADRQTLVAQTIPNGYQLVDTTARKAMTLLKTSLQDCFLATTNTDPGTTPATGIVFRNNSEWTFQYYKDGTLVSQKLAIKF